MPEYPDFRQEDFRRLRVVNRSLAEWERYEADQALPEAERRNLPMPAGFSHEQLLELRAMLEEVVFGIQAPREWNTWLRRRQN